MPSEVLTELWNTKDRIAEEHDYDIDKLADYYRKKQTKMAASRAQRNSNPAAEHNAPVDPSAAPIF